MVGLRGARPVSDTLLVPVQPRSFDIWAIVQMGSLVAEGRDNASARAALAEVEGLEMIEAQLVRRRAYSNAAAQGAGIGEMQPMGAKAMEELSAFAAALFL